MDRESGFTLVELIITIAMIAVISAVALPNFLDWLPNHRLRSAAHDLFSNFQKAKLEAIKRNINTTVCFSSGGYEIFVDQNTDFVKDGAEEAVAEVDDDIMEAYLSETPVAPESLIAAIRKETDDRH